jgi:hypothetical protein
MRMGQSATDKRYNFSLHEKPHGRVYPLHIAVHRELQVILRFFPLDAVLENAELCTSKLDAPIPNGLSVQPRVCS